MAKVINQIIEWIPTTDKRKPCIGEEVLVMIPFHTGADGEGEKCFSIERATYDSQGNGTRFYSSDIFDAGDYLRGVTHWAFAYQKVKDVKIIKEDPRQLIGLALECLFGELTPSKSLKKRMLNFIKRRK